MAVLFLTEDDVRRLLGMSDALELVESAFRSLAAGTASNQPRQRVVAPHGAVLHVMAAADPAAGYMAVKIYSTSREGARFLVLLYHSSTGEPLAEIEADYLGQVRTGAASGVATRYMARHDASVLAVIGTGKQALTQAQAIAQVRRLREIRVYGRDAERRAHFAEAVERETGVRCLPSPAAREAVAGAHIVVTATNAREPVLLAEWLEPGMHVNAIGGNHPKRSELDVAAVARASLIVTDSIEQARQESGELLSAFGVPASESGPETPERRHTPRAMPARPDAGPGRRPVSWASVAELHDVVSGRRPGRENDSDITLFKSNGIALEDVAVAGFIYEQARQRGIGREIPVFEQ